MSGEITNLESQKDEVEALSAIYENDFTLHDQNTFDLRICCDEEKWWAVTIAVLLPITYPTMDPPVFEVHTECLSTGELDAIYKQLDLLWQENIGSNILYIWVGKIREILFEKYDSAKLFIESTEEEKKRERKYIIVIISSKFLLALWINNQYVNSYELYSKHFLVNKILK